MRQRQCKVSIHPWFSISKWPPWTMLHRHGTRKSSLALSKWLSPKGVPRRKTSWLMVFGNHWDVKLQWIVTHVSPFIYGKLFTEVKWLDRQQRMYLPTCLSLWFLIRREFEIQQYQRQLFLVEHCVSWHALHTMTWHRSVQPCCNKNPQDKVMLIGFGSWMRTVLMLLYDASQNVFAFIVQGAWWEVPGRVYSYNLICNSRWSSRAWKEVQPSEIWENRKAHCKPMFSWRQVRKETETDFSYHFHRQCPSKAGKW